MSFPVSEISTFLHVFVLRVDNSYPLLLRDRTNPR